MNTFTFSLVFFLQNKIKNAHHWVTVFVYSDGNCFIFYLLLVVSFWLSMETFICTIVFFFTCDFACYCCRRWCSLIQLSSKLTLLERNRQWNDLHTLKFDAKLWIVSPCDKRRMSSRQQHIHCKINNNNNNSSNGMIYGPTIKYKVLELKQWSMDLVTRWKHPKPTRRMQTTSNVPLYGSNFSIVYSSYLSWIHTQFMCRYQ